MTNDTSRRGFIGAASLAGAAPIMAASTGRVIGSNDRIGVGHIGVGGNGTGLLRRIVKRSESMGDVKSLAVCDVYSRHRERAAGITGLAAKDTYVDYKELLARGDIDAVMISTPDHWHADMAIDAMNAGKDVYLQKPMTLTVDEARRVAETAQEERAASSRSAASTSPTCATTLLARWSKAAKSATSSGRRAPTPATRRLANGTTTSTKRPTSRPSTGKRWLGSAPQRPFSGERFFRWRKYWDYSGGIATDLFYHRLGPLLYSIGSEFPTRVTGSGGVYVQKDREVPDTYSTTIEFPNYFVNMSASMANSAAIKYVPVAIYGHQGTIIFDGPQGEAPARTHLRSRTPPRQGWHAEGSRAWPPRHELPITSPTGSPASAPARPRASDPDFGHQVMTAIKLGVDSYREGKVMSFDAKSGKLTDRPAPRPAYEGDRRQRPRLPLQETLVSWRPASPALYP